MPDTSELEMCPTPTAKARGVSPAVARTGTIFAPALKRAPFIVTADNISALALGWNDAGEIKPEKALEAQCGAIWKGDSSPAPTPAKCATALLRDYSEGWGWRHNRPEIRQLIALIEKEGKLNKAVAARANFLYQTSSNPEGMAALYLRYLLVHCSGHYTKELQNRVIEANAKELLASLGAALESTTHLYPA